MGESSGHRPTRQMGHMGLMYPLIGLHPIARPECTVRSVMSARPRTTPY